MRASARTALLHPVGLSILGASLLLAIAMLLLPALRLWSDRAIWVLLLGVATYAAVVAGVACSPPTSTAPEIDKLRKIRQGIAGLLAERQSVPIARQDPVLIGALVDAIKYLDEQLIPALTGLLGRQASLRKHLSLYERGELHAPTPGELERLRKIFANRKIAIDACVQEAANAYATLVALLQEGDDADVAARARTWAEDLATLHDSLTEVLRGDDDSAQADGGPTAAPGDRAAPESPPEPAPAGPDVNHAAPNVRPNMEPDAGCDEAPQRDEEGEAVEQDAEVLRQEIEALRLLVEAALKCLNDPALLAECGLIGRLPLTLAAARTEEERKRRGPPMPFEQAPVLRRVLIASVGRLQPDGEAPRGRGDLKYRVLEGLYVRGRNTRQVMMQCDIAEATLHRYRRDGVRAVTRQLAQQEARLRRDEPDVAIG